MQKDVKVDLDGWMTFKLIQIGNSIGVVLPKPVFERLGKGKGDTVKIKIKDLDYRL